MSRYFLDYSQGNALIGHHGQSGTTKAMGAGPLNPYFLTGFSEDSASRICLELKAYRLVFLVGVFNSNTPNPNEMVVVVLSPSSSTT